jgi:tetratricopeptide (TPR) repeat protein
MRGSRPVDMIGRQLTRVGALAQRFRLLALAEESFRAAHRRSPNLSWATRLARIQESRRRWAAADATYTRCLELAGPSPEEQRRLAGLHYQQGRVRYQLADWRGADAAFTAALRLRPESAVWHAQQARARERLADWPAAVASYREAVRLVPDRAAWVTGLVGALSLAGRPDLAVEAGTAGLAESPGHVPLLRALLDAQESVGDWPAAADLLRTLVACRPRDHALRSRLAQSLEQLGRIPSGLTGRAPAPPGAGDADRDPDRLTRELVDQLRHLATHAPRRPGEVYRLGRLYERSGQFAQAEATYRLALHRLSAIDAWWCHKSAYDWEFRLAYVRERGSPSATPGGQLSRTAVPVAGAVPDGEPAGFFDLLMARESLRLSGFLLPGSWREVEIRLDGQLVKRVHVDLTRWRPTFRFSLGKSFLGDLPEWSRLTIQAGGRPLVTTGGTGTVQVHVPDGTGEAGRKLAGGLVPTKKGSWPLTGPELAAQLQRYLDVYAHARQLLAEQGRALFLCYGTLLGCHREGNFIAGDDDFDVSYVSHAADPELFREECQQIALELIRRGLDITFAINGRMFKIGLADVWIDVTPIWFHHGRAWSFNAHDLAPGLVEPVRADRFLGREVDLPRDPAAFLADAYGPDWATPQPGFRYYRSRADSQLLSRMWARPSEVRQFTRLARAERAGNRSAGRFTGVGAPGYPGFSWLCTETGDSAPPAADGAGGPAPVMARDAPAAGGG